MLKRFSVLCFVCMMGLWLPTAVSRALLPPPATTHTPFVLDPTGGDPISPGIGIATSWYSQETQSIHKGAGIVSYYNLTVYGQNICTAFGDPYTPLNSPWTTIHPYPYEYRIRIPADYAHDIVRVELFDPDSMNANNPGTITISRTNAAIEAGLSPTTTGSCTTNRKDFCLISTGELPLVDNGTLTLEQINPYYFWRIDENRGAGSPPGNGLCGAPSTYNATFNTRTLFDLYYWRQNPDGTVVLQNLASYTGQVGDGVRDNGDHDTDRRWVSPGAAQSFDQPVFVPADPGSPGDFEIDLTSETPGIIIDPETGDRYLYLNVYGLEGASKNGYDLWAGPPDYVATVPSNVNDRNLAALNSPGSHNPQGIEIEALENLLLNSNYSNLLEIPLAEVDPEYAGANLNVTLFDSDSGSQPPITFIMDTPVPDDWSITFGVPGVPDPDGQVRNCLPGSCNNQFIMPPYAISLPRESEACDYANPDPEVCTPFYGGRLKAQYQSGIGDTYLWQITNLTEPPPNNDPGVGCSAFPIAIHEGNRSVTPPGQGANPFPDEGDFDGNYDPPAYTDFINHVPDAPLLEAQPGYVYRVWNGFGNGNFGWLRWNTGLTANDVNLAASLSWPGNSLDYTDNGAQGSPVPGSGYGWPVYGYIDPGDPTDQEMHIQDWVAANTGVGNAAVVRDTLDEHINLGRTLRLLVWDVADGINSYHTFRFALFKIHGYNLSQGWLLLEFIGRDESCGQLQPDLTVIGQPQLLTPLPLGANLPVSFSVTIENVGDVDVDSQFFVDIFIDPTIVLTTGIPITESSGFTAVPALAAGESRVITVTAQQGFTTEPFTHTVYAMVDSLEEIAESDETNNISVPLLVTDVHPLLAGVTLAGPSLGLTGETYTFTAVVTPSTITDPITYTWLVDAAPPLTQTNGTAVAAPFGWPIPGTYTLTITATHGFNAVTDTHTIVITDTPITDLAVIGVPQLLTPPLIQPQQPVSFSVTIANEGNIPITGSFQADIFLDPAVVLTDSIPITQSAGFVMVNGLGVGETAVLTFSVPSGFSNGLFERTVYAMVDSTQVITEVDETNNISAPLSLDVFWRLYLPVIRKS